jgi:hypothetical protein
MNKLLSPWDATQEELVRFIAIYNQEMRKTFGEMCMGILLDTSYSKAFAWEGLTMRQLFDRIGLNTVPTMDQDLRCMPLHISDIAPSYRAVAKWRLEIGR